MTSKRPPIEDIEAACIWLDLNEGGSGEAEACRRVAVWLSVSSQEAEIRAAARQAGCSPRYFRKMLKERNA